MQRYQCSDFDAIICWVRLGSVCDKHIFTLISKKYWECIFFHQYTLLLLLLGFLEILEELIFFPVLKSDMGVALGFEGWQPMLV